MCLYEKVHGVAMWSGVKAWSKTTGVLAPSSGESELAAAVRASTGGLGFLTSLMQLLRLGWFIDSDSEKFDIWLWETYGFSITFFQGKFAFPKCRDWRIRVMRKQSTSDQNHCSATRKHVIGRLLMEKFYRPHEPDEKAYFAVNKM